MNTLRNWFTGLVLTLGAAVSGCGGASGMMPVCAAGASVACTCTNGNIGAQICSSDGSGFAECMCSAGMGGSVGSGGSPATGGATGLGGSPATGGVVGTGGVTGTGGSPGLGGALGTGGLTGLGGAPATGGSPGLGGTGGSPATGGATGTGGAIGTGGAYTGRWVSVQFIDAIIAPAEANGSPWDGIGTVDPSILEAVATALVGANPVADVLAAMANPALASFDPPDPYGEVQATVFGVTGPIYPGLASSTNPVPNTYDPIWPNGGFEYTNVPIDSDVRITVELWDSDLVYDDTIGAAVINSSHLKAALAAQQKYEVQVNDQTNGQLLFIGIQVVQQAGEL